MCGRYARFTPQATFDRLAGFNTSAESQTAPPPSWNSAPGATCALICRELDQPPAWGNQIWGLIPHWAKQRPSARPINARLETAAEKQMYKRIFRLRRCLIAADGWYEWHATTQGKQPYYLHYQDARPFFFGGLWNEWVGPDNAMPIRTFTILTQPATPDISPLHPRVPVIVPSEHYADWLNKEIWMPQDVQSLCTPPALGELCADRVSTAVNRTDGNRAEFIQPLEKSSEVVVFKSDTLALQQD